MWHTNQAQCCQQQLPGQHSRWRVPNIPGLSQPSPAICGECWAGLAEQWKGRKRHLRVEGEKRQNIWGEQSFEKGISFLFLLLWVLEGGKHSCNLCPIVNTPSVVLDCTSPLCVRECQKSRASLGVLNLCGQAQMTWGSAFGFGSQLRQGPFKLFTVREDLESPVQSCNLQRIYKEMLFAWAGKGILLFWISKKLLTFLPDEGSSAPMEFHPILQNSLCPSWRGDLFWGLPVVFAATLVAQPQHGKK